MMRRVLESIAFGGGLLAASMSSAEVIGDPTTGRKLTGQCRTCHGIDGVAKIPIAPTIAGEQADYVARQLAAFRSGARVHEMMSVVTKSLSDQDIADLAAWYASIPITAGEAPALVESVEACVSCHGENGIAVVEDVPHLAGETVMYLDTQLKAFRTGKRPSDVMRPMASDLSNADIRLLSDWFSQISLKTEMKE
jgi:cytochrome c553